MVLYSKKCINGIRFLLDSSVSCTHFHASCENRSILALSSSNLSSPLGSLHYEEEEKLSDLDVVVAKVRLGSSDSEVVKCLVDDPQCQKIKVTQDLVDRLLRRFKDDWKSALGVFKWAESRSGFKHTPNAYDVLLDVLGKMKQMDKMMGMLGEMHRDSHPITLNTVAKVMRRFAGAGKWEDAVRMFDEVDAYGLAKNTEAMNLLLDTLCKSNKVEQAREIFLELKQHISPNAHTFNIFIHGWCKVNRVDEAHWTIQEMKGHGCRPCVISYSTIVEFYCRRYNFGKVYEMLDEMQAQGCPPNVVTFTTIMCFLTKSEEFEEALQIAERMKSVGCSPDTLFYNALIHALGRAGQVQEAIQVFEVEMPMCSVPPNTSTYNTMIAMFCHHGQSRKALDLLTKMEISGVCKPDVQTYYPLLKACLRYGQVDSLSKLLDDMIRRHHLSLDISTYTLLIHGLCRANKCEWAYHLFEEMIGQDVKPRYQTCRLLFDEVKEKHMYDAADRIEYVMKKL
ncbi:pentatricopeptide repeat-containing protein At3g04130, mitochondrial [Ziziphus jujuba]|uniref:Pentatricopeptide repeat-containing protein At3g04130, mitochondrial n=1 Tax=Ziziphus jujuba TaxID=326968 RepID=A0A6P4AFR9_ZIZJJ|nr:pentatricopeptide repeat-containing protein At3g04130, mitochondrial [Ziziphus jujuba]XP_015894350.1 pentatricopeptide repeat-containing protein At3g04130, mitochondrial [Ziziphus jujuba]XP_048318262.1 pentatricopeptide repeat-containing protein At3g04130, mitochondrial [Ziziphus jujuba]XP_048318263.1 pentatricopeptide repeat-containing protein At3g04130, mitochondrial [Ziziphus jujuba var. spinosa]